MRGSSPVKKEHEYDATLLPVLMEQCADFESAETLQYQQDSIPVEQHSFSPRKTMSTFRQHVYISGSKSRQRRGALADVHGDTAYDGGALGSETFTDQGNAAPSPSGHAKKLSLGRNLVGSIRTIASRHVRSPPRKDGKENLAPSSVAIIPSPRPTLTLDLDTSEEFLPQDFGRATELTKDERMLTLTGTPNPVSSQEPASPIIEPENLDEKDVDTSTVDSVPETEASGDDPSDMFERSVDANCKSLKRMISLDAMAERCTQSPDGMSPKGLVVSKQDSATTVLNYPSDMQEITRQPARVSPTVLVDDQDDGKWKSDDPFAPGTPSIRVYGPEITLPFRPKIVLHQASGAESGAEVESRALSEFSSHLRQITESDTSGMSSFDQKTMSPAAKHRSMVSEVLEIADNDGEIDLVAVFDVGNPEGESALYGPVFLDVDPISETRSRTDSGEQATRGVHNTQRSENADFKYDPESALHDAILDNYDLQVALGGVDITCDDQPLHWARQDDDVQDEKNHDLGNAVDRTPDCKVLPGANAPCDTATQTHDYDIFLDQMGSDSSEGSNILSVEDEDREYDGSLKDAMDMYRSYNAEHGVGVVETLLEAVDSPNSPSSVKSGGLVKRSSVPNRYRVRGGRYQQ